MIRSSFHHRGRRLLPLRVFLVAALVPLAIAATEAEATSLANLTLESSRGRATWGEPIKFTGRLTSSDGSACVGHTEIVLTQDTIDDGEAWIDVGRTTTDEQGYFEVFAVADVSSDYVAESRPNPSSGCGAMSSPRVRVLVRLYVDVERSALSVRRGDRVRLTVSVEPECPLDAAGEWARIPLHQLQNGHFVRVAAKRDTNYDCSATFTRRIHRLSVFKSRVRGIENVARLYLPGSSQEQAVDVVP